MPVPRTAVIFRTHFWDAFCQRQFTRLQAVAQGTDVFVLVDETHGPVRGIPHSQVVSVTQDGLLKMGFADAGEGSLLWFNGDYPLYRFMELYPDYDYYLQLEYDVIINRPLTSLIGEIQSRSSDYVGLTKGGPASTWFWLGTMLGAYEESAVRHQLICLCVFSRAALRHLWQARLRQSVAFHQESLSAWPFCEGFVPTELVRAGFSVAELSDFGSTDSYDHWPPILETEAEALQSEGFLHPVLDQPRYISSLQKYHIGVTGYLNPNSLFHRKLRRLPARAYVGAIYSSLGFKIRRDLGRSLASLRSGRRMVLKKASF